MDQEPEAFVVCVRGAAGRAVLRHPEFTSHRFKVLELTENGELVVEITVRTMHEAFKLGRFVERVSGSLLPARKPS
jgi:hypothetical protein